MTNAMDVIKQILAAGGDQRKINEIVMNDLLSFIEKNKLDLMRIALAGPEDSDDCELALQCVAGCISLHFISKSERKEDNEQG